jgi:hypothetical protein
MSLDGHRSGQRQPQRRISDVSSASWAARFDAEPLPHADPSPSVQWSSWPAFGFARGRRVVGAGARLRRSPQHATERATRPTVVSSRSHRLRSGHMPIDMKALARMGAQARLAALQQEVDQIHRAFPDLGGTRSGRSMPQPDAPAGGRRSMSAAARKAVSTRMRRYWAARRQAGPTPQAPGGDDAGSSSASAASTASAASGTPRKRTMSAAAKPRISAAPKKRGASVRAAGKKKR